MHSAIFAGVLTVAIALAFWIVQIRSGQAAASRAPGVSNSYPADPNRLRDTRASAVVGLACIYGFGLEGISLSRSSDLTTAVLPFVLVLVLMAMTAPALTALYDQVQQHEGATNRPVAAAARQPATASGTEHPLTRTISDFQNLSAVTSAVVLFGGVALIPYAFHIDDTASGTAFVFVAGLTPLLAVAWGLVRRSLSTGASTLAWATRWLVVGNLAGVLACWLASYGVFGTPKQPTPVARDVIRLQAPPKQEKRLPKDAATYRVDLTVTSQEDLHGRFVWVANVQQATDRGLAQMPAAAFAEVPCYPVSGTHWRCDPIHLGQCKDLSPGPYMIYVVLLTPTDVHDVHSGPVIHVAGDEALDPVRVSPTYGPSRNAKTCT